MSAGFAAFLRNVNLGRPNSPARGELEDAFVAAGATSARSFLVNGTLVFTVAPGTRPRAVASRACERLRASCGLREPVFVRRVAELAALVARDPFAGVALAEGDACCISFLHGERAGLPPLPFANARGDVLLREHTGAEVLSVSRVVGKAAGSPNALLERLLGVPATTRNWRTVVRLVEKFA